jgi:hypothetical protein
VEHDKHKSFVFEKLIMENAQKSTDFSKSALLAFCIPVRFCMTTPTGHAGGSRFTGKAFNGQQTTIKDSR